LPYNLPKRIKFQVTIKASVDEYPIQQNSDDGNIVINILSSDGI